MQAVFKKFTNIPQKPEIYLYCSMNKQYVKTVQ